MRQITFTSTSDSDRASAERHTETTQSARGYTRTKLTPRSWEWSIRVIMVKFLCNNNSINNVRRVKWRIVNQSAQYNTGFRQKSCLPPVSTVQHRIQTEIVPSTSQHSTTQDSDRDRAFHQSAQYNTGFREKAPVPVP